MSPSRIIREAEALGLGMAALTDHNCGRNLHTFDMAARESSIIPVFGLEVTTMEEAHVLALFPTARGAEALGLLVESLLPSMPSAPDLFGDQVYVDEDDFILGEVEFSLLQAAEISLEDLFREVSERGGLFIPAHIDRPSFSVVSQLGFLPPLAYSAVECTRLPCSVDTGGNCIICSSDAHYPGDIGKRYISFETELPGFEGLCEALASCSLTPLKRS
jgi:PHP family Zn ribbon phosphoesterase